MQGKISFPMFRWRLDESLRKGIPKKKKKERSRIMKEFGRV